MELLSGLISFLTGLIASTLILANLMFSTISSLLPPPVQSEPAVLITRTATSTSPSVAETPASPSPSTTTTKTASKVPTATQPVVSKPAPTAKTPLTPLLSPEQVNINTRTSIVNILCSVQSSGSLRSISGSGVIIDARGIILTNAHIAQYFLLRDYPSKDAVSCVVRTGSPATPAYRAELLYLPPLWIDANASQITAEHGLGTGENDYAFLHITEPTNPNATLPSLFPNIAMTAASPDTGDQALVAGYPAGFLDSITVERNLYATSAFTTIGQLYTFDSPTRVDVVSLGGTVVSQGGSSGGAVVRTYDGKLTGLIATATVGTTTASRDLRAITIGHIDRSLRQAGKGGLVELLSADLTTLAADFAVTLFIKEKNALIEALTSSH